MRRREFLESVGRVGGAGAVYGTMVGLGLLPSPAEAGSTAGSGSFRLGGEPGRGRKVVILGAGLAGMCAAYELGKQGYDCHILEARTRPGGRCHTIRRGTVEVERGGMRQVCDFDAGQYLNPGPARIPQHHVTLDYCREFGVAVEPFTQVNEAAYYYHEGSAYGALGGKRVRAREAKADLYGYTHELLCKALSQSALDAAITAEDKERLFAFLVTDGGLSRDTRRYSGWARRGFDVAPGAGDVTGSSPAPYALHDLLQAGLSMDWLDEYEMEWQPTLFQIVGGTDGIAKAFARRVGQHITYEAAVTEIRQNDRGVTVAFSGRDGKHRTFSGDYCICTLPLSVLKSVPADFSPAFQKAIEAGSDYGVAAKIGLQFKRRFWEEDEHIFGGITRTNLPITQIFYPSYGYLGKKGVLVGFYNYDQDAVNVGKLTHTERVEFALRNGEKIHPQYRKEFETAFSVAWGETPYSLGAWVNWDPGSRRDAYALLNRPDGRVYLAGEHMSYINGWMAGALESARLVCRNLHERAGKESKA